MSAIRSKNTKAELALKKAMRQQKLQFGIHCETLPGRPDFTFTREKLAVFCDGDFWHGRNWADRKARAIKVRRAYWIQKIEGNMARDARNNKELRKLGWRVIRIWETDILRDPVKAAKRVVSALSKQRPKKLIKEPHGKPRRHSK